jgi:hypothetical protein
VDVDMKKVERNEVMPIGDYEQIRPRFRARVIEEKRARRVALGEHMSAIFENHDSVLLQIQEMLRTERITRESSVLHEIETYNDLIPGPNELSATLFLEIPEKELRERLLVELCGLESCFRLEIDGVACPGRNETRGVMPDRTTAVHYVKFPVPEASAKAMASKKAGEVALVVEHPKYQARTVFSAATLHSLSEDFES